MTLKFKKFEQAYELLKKSLEPTPLVKNEWLSKQYGCEVFLKLENLQPVGSFKLRGAFNMIANLSDEEKAKGVFAVSAGNHAQGVAWAASIFKIKATIIMPEPSPLVKVMNTEALGAKVILAGENVDESFEFAKKYQKDHDEIFVHPYNQDDVIYGQGSLGFELKEQIDKIDFLFGSVGGGGLVTGVGTVVKNFFPDCRVIASQAAGANAMVQSLQTGKMQKSEKVSTFADGIKVRKPEKKMFELLDGIVDEAIEINDSKIALSVLQLMEQARVIAEGAGAINLAAFTELHALNPRRFKNKKVVLIICGGNIDINLVDRIIEKGLIESKRRVKIKVLLEDRPGSLNHLTTTIKDTGANVLQAVHKRDVPDIELNQSIVEVILESRGQEHTEEILKSMSEHYKLIGANL